MSDTQNTYSTPKLDGTGLSQVWSLILEAFVKQEDGKGLSTKDFTNELMTKLTGIATGAQVNAIESITVNDAAVEIDENKAVNVTVPTGALANKNSVSQGDLDTALAAIISGKANSTAVYSKDETYSKEEVNAKVSGVYKFQGSIGFSELPTGNLENGYTYNITDAFTTTQAFIEGEGKDYPAGTNVAWVAAQEKWDALAGIYDFSAFVKKTDLRSLTEAEIAAICVIPPDEEEQTD